MQAILQQAFSDFYEYSNERLRYRDILCFILRTVVRGNFNIHGTKNFQDAVFHQKSKFFKHPEALVEVSTSIFK